MAARLATPTQSTTTGPPSPGGTVRELIVIPELQNSIHLQHAIQQVSSTVVEVNGDSSGHSSPATEQQQQHTYITVAMQGSWDPDIDPMATVKTELSDHESEGGNGVNYHVQYVEPQELYTQEHQTHMESLRSYPVYGVTSVNTSSEAEAEAWAGGPEAELAAYGVVVGGDEAEAPASPATQPHPRMPPATVQWLLDNYETADGVSLPRSTLYAHYLRHCTSHRLDPVNAASFGKLIRSVFVGLRTRRLGTRGNSKYHYYGIRAKPTAGDSPQRLDAEDKGDADPLERCEREVAPSPVQTNSPHRQYLGVVRAPSPPPPPALDLDLPPCAHRLLAQHHRDHGAEFLEAVAALDTAAVERTRRAFWRRPPPPLCRKVLYKMAARREVADWLNSAELALYQRAVELLLPDVLRPIPPHLTQAIRNFAKSLEAALSAGAAGAPAVSARAQAAAASALAGALRRYTSLNHLAQAARAVLTNQHQIQQMLADLNRVDFRVVREQAAWACSCGNSATAHRLEADFKATLGRGATLEQWAAWLENCVRLALAPHERKPDYSARARRLLLDWSFYSSLVIRELTLRSAASFGSFHLIRLLYDEYVAYLIERRVAQHERTAPIAVMHGALHSEEEESKFDDDPSRLDGDSSRLDGDEDDPDWEWGDDEEEEDDAIECKKPKVN